MVSINYSAREVCCKIVYYGPGLSGKTTNLPSNTRGKLISLATEADRTLYFDFLPINIGTINGFQAKFQLYTVPGQVYYNATRKLVLRGVDGLVFVADSQPDKMDENIESLANLEENLLEYGYSIDDIPVVIQYNKRDLPGVLPVEQLQARLNTKGWQHFEASATIGNGVFDTLKLIIKLVLEKAKSASSAKIASAHNMVVPNQEMEPQPVAIGPSTDRSLSPATPQPSPGSVGTQQVSSVPEERPGASATYRPYPGSEHGAHPESPSPASQPPERAEHRSPAKPEGERIAGKLATKKPAVGSTPRMAPPLRRRGETKKRGFFKRLFGIR
jgi:signal recognition particle receptor subunit beta